MPNPWLNVPLADYEGHMSSPVVQQSTALAALFAEALALRRPASVAILGIAGGNGLEHIDPAVTRRIVGIDINPQYLEAVRARYPHLGGLELHLADLAAGPVGLPPVDLVHAALFLEHAGTDRALENAIALVAPNGALAVVLQLPGDPSQNIGDSGYASLKAHASHFTLIDPDRFTATLLARDFSLTHQTTRPVPAGKSLHLALFTRNHP